MRLDDNGQTVSAMDVLFPQIGEIIGGSQREERLEVLEQRMDEMNIPKKIWSGTSTPGVLRLSACRLRTWFRKTDVVCYGMGNIRDVIPFARTPKNCEF